MEVIRKMYGRVKNQDGSWRVRTCKEINLLIRLVDIEAQRINFIGHIVRMGKERMGRRITEWTPVAVRRIVGLE
jgi:hypothetical protein